MTSPLQHWREYLVSSIRPVIPRNSTAIVTWRDNYMFFPAGTGTTSADSWNEATPGSRSVEVSRAALRERDVLVVGNFPGSQEQYPKMLQQPESAYQTTWRNLRTLLADIAPKRVYLTNAHLAMFESSPSFSPGDSEFLAACEELLQRQIEMVRPRVVVCLGAPAAFRLTRLVDGLESWASWPGFASLISEGQTVQRIHLSGMQIDAIAVHHPSAIVSRVEREAQGALISNLVRSRTDRLDHAETPVGDLVDA